jgi:hypothetical protein
MSPQAAALPLTFCSALASQSPPCATRKHHVRWWWVLQSSWCWLVSQERLCRSRCAPSEQRCARAVLLLLGVDCLSGTAVACHWGWDAAVRCDAHHQTPNLPKPALLAGTDWRLVHRALVAFAPAHCAVQPHSQHPCIPCRAHRYGLAIGASLSWLVRLLMVLCSPIAWPVGRMLDWLLGSDHSTLFRRKQLKVRVVWGGGGWARVRAVQPLYLLTW